MSNTIKVGDLYSSDLVLGNGWYHAWVVFLRGDTFTYSEQITAFHPNKALLVLAVRPTTCICLYMGQCILVHNHAFFEHFLGEQEKEKCLLNPK